MFKISNLRSFKVIRLILVGFLLFFISGQLLAGEIKGYVFDKETKEPLIGCNVYLSGTTVGTVTNIDGYYHLPLVKPGKYTLVASYIGYNDMEIEIEVVADEVREQNFELTVESVGIAEVVVTVQTEGQIRAINRQINANAIINVVSAKRIQELPDANAAESLGRLPGVSLVRNNGEGDMVVIRGMEPKYNLITINGVRAPSFNSYDNSVGMAGISPYMLESIEVQKSLTPDHEADVIGGIVNLKLREAPEELKGNIIFENVFNTLSETYWNPKLTIQGSNRFFKNRFGIFLQANYEKNNRPNDRMSGSYELSGTNMDVIRVSGASFSRQQLVRERFGGSLYFDYKLKNGKLTLNSFLNGLAEDEFNRTRTYNIDLKTIRNANTISNAVSSAFVNSFNYEQKLFLNSKLDAGLSYNMARWEKPEARTLTTTWQNLNFNQEQLYDRSPYELTDIAELNDSTAFIYSLNQRGENFKENEISTQFNWEFPVRVKDLLNGYLKFGAQYRYKERDNKADAETATLTNGGDFPIREAIADQNPDIDFSRRIAQHLPVLPIMDHNYQETILDGKFTLEDFLQRKYITQIFDRLDTSDWVDNGTSLVNIDDYLSDYHGTEKYSAAYIMADVTLLKYFKIVGGIRYEKMKTDYQSYGVNDIGQGSFLYEKLRDSLRYDQYFLPMVNVKIKPFRWMDIRFGYTQSIARPSYFNFMPRYYRDYYRTLQEVGNTFLHPALSHNFDLYLSFYSNKIGLFTIGGFYKRIEGFEYRKRITVINDSTDNAIHGYDIMAAAGQTITLNLNNPDDGYVQGVEVDWQGTFSYLPKPFNGIVININYTLLSAKTNYYVGYADRVYYGPRPWQYNLVQVDSTISRPLIRQPGSIFNVRIGYDYRGFSAYIAYNYQGKTLSELGGLYKERDRYTSAYGRLDFSIRQRLPLEGLQVFLNGSNMTNSFNQDFQSDASKFPTSESYFGTQITLGLRYEFP